MTLESLNGPVVCPGPFNSPKCLFKFPPLCLPCPFVFPAGEFLVGPARVLFLDEISTGLDSSTTWLLTNCLRNMAHMQQMTILVALLQPPPEGACLYPTVLIHTNLLFKLCWVSIAAVTVTCRHVASDTMILQVSGPQSGSDCVI